MSYYYDETVKPSFITIHFIIQQKQFGQHVHAGDSLKARPNKPFPTRSEQMKALEDEVYDVLVIGGGATEAGCALDSVSRGIINLNFVTGNVWKQSQVLINFLGLKTAIVELYDFSSGTSSRSTKLLHGGVRYLQKAIFNLDIEQYRMVKEALHERANLLEIAPHLSYPLPIVKF
jgi:glycerol-3-phosphate dehydrogenase